jgi:pyruvate dehydrogenase E2 component (dihydrolipoamide acetyltransferase)
MEEIKLPKMGQSVEEAEIVTWLKQEGDSVNIGDALFTIQTDKAEIECESTAAGVLRKILVQPGIEVPVLSVVALVGSADEAVPDNVQTAGQAAPSPAATPVAQAAAPDPSPEEQQPAEAATRGSAGAVSPRARQAASQHHIDPSSLQGSGVEGRVMEADVLAYADRLDQHNLTPTARRIAGAQGTDVSGIQGSGVGGKVTKADLSQGTQPQPAAATPAPAATAAPAPRGRKPLSPMRRIIAQRMSESLFSAPHYYVTVEVDMSAAKRFRDGLRTFKASYNDLVLHACMQALRQWPAVNARWHGDSIEEVSDVNLGMAVALPTGLIVPVIRQAQHLSLEGLAAKTRELATKAQTGKLVPDDYAGNTFTVSNLGAFGVDHFTAIINQPDSAILAVGQMKDRVVVVDGGIHIRPILKLTLSSDHRVIDGAIAAQFMGTLKTVIEQANF